MVRVNVGNLGLLLIPSLVKHQNVNAFQHLVNVGWRRPSFLTRFSSTDTDSDISSAKGKLLVLGGTGFLGQAVCKRAILEGYQVTSLSRRGLPPPSSNDGGGTSSRIDYRQGDARKKEPIENILKEGGYVGIVHAVGLLLDEESGLGAYNRFASGSGSLPDTDATYDTITRLTAFNAMEVVSEYAVQNDQIPFPFVFTSAAEAGWPDMAGGSFVENNLAPEWLGRYLKAKRQVESKLESSSNIRAIIPRPSLIYSLDRPASFPPVGAFFLGNAVGLPFVDRPVTVQALASCIVRSISRQDVSGVLRYSQIDELCE